MKMGIEHHQDVRKIFPAVIILCRGELLYHQNGTSIASSGTRVQ